MNDRMLHTQKPSVEMLKPALNKYNNQEHGTTKVTPKKAHNWINAVKV